MKDYLLVECANVEQTLHESLRYRYVEEDAPEYFDECATRLKAIRSLIEKTPANNISDLQQWRAQLSVLSSLITHIERSHLEEFSWPFAYALQRISTAVCTDQRGKPLFFFMAEGGPVSYAVRADRYELGVRRRRIYSVFFPRTLKDYVLLHAIFGHEMGHAAIHARNELSAIISRLVSSSIIADKEKLYSWCAANIGVGAKVSDQYLQSQSISWSRELFSDLFGLIMMGPAFIPAFQVLLEPGFSRGAAVYVPSHPPYPCRMLALHHAAEALGTFSIRGAANPLMKPLEQSFNDAASKWRSTAFNVLDKSAVQQAAKELESFASGYGDLRYPEPDADVLVGLVAALAHDVPPCEPYPSSRIKDKKIDPSPVVDFRHIMQAGWIRWSQVAAGPTAPTDFTMINRFCAHAILQQEGIRRWHTAPDATAEATA